MRLDIRQPRTLLRLAPAVLFAVTLLWFAAGLATATGNHSITQPAPFAGVSISLVLDASGFPVITHYGDIDDPENIDLEVVHCNDQNCAGGDESIAVVDTDSLGGDVSMALDASGNPVVSYYDAANFLLKVLHCGDANCTSGNSITVPNATDFTGISSSLVLDSTGNPVISYRAGGGMKVMHCDDPDCSGGGESISLAVSGVSSP